MFMSMFLLVIVFIDVTMLKSLLIFISNGYVHVYVIDSVYSCYYRVIVIINVHIIFLIYVIVMLIYVNACVVVLIYMLSVIC